MKRLSLSLSSACLLAFFIGCNAKNGGENAAKGGETKTAQPAKPGADTPEAAFEVMKKGFGEGGKWGDILQVCHPKQKNVMPLMFLVVGGFSILSAKDQEAAKTEYDKLLADAGFKKKEGENLVDMNEMEDPAKAIAMADRMFEGKDAAAFLNAVQAFMKKHQKKDEFAGGFAALVDVKTEGDTSTGMIDMGEGKEKKQLSFAKVDGRWYIEIQKFFK